MATPKVFTSFAAEDAWARDLFVGQGRHPDTPWTLADWSLHEAFTEAWKTQTRSRIRRCDVVIQLVGKGTYRADGAIWEVNCATDEGVPAFGIWISATDRGPIPSCFNANNIINWTWEGVATMIKRATQQKVG